ncbi:MAG: ABC transporter permease subunit [Firmicutes bacterium]|nr:ABC transporter permease subunit [Bacillota bacterium]
MKKKEIFYNLICPFIGVIVFVCVWAIAAAIYGKPLILPDVGSVLVSFFKLFASGDFYASMGMTFLRSVACFVMAYVLALPLALASAFSASLAGIIRPITDFFRTLPVIAIILVTLILFPSTFTPIAVGFLTVFPLLYSALYNSLTCVAMRKNLDMCRAYNVGKRNIAKYLYMPALIPSSFAQAETLLPLAVKVVVSGEVLAYTRVGLGLAMHSAQLNVETDKLVAYAFVAALLSFVASLSVKLIRLICRRLKLCR